jgi:O-antigen/teichoic acid export membrane protein
VLKAVFKNSSYLLVSQLFVKVFAFAYAIFLAGNIGASDFGTYSAALSIFGLMSLFSDLGINRVLTRDIARDESELTKLFSTAMLLRALSAAISFLALTVFFYFTDPSSLRFTLTTIALLSLVPQSIALSIDAILIGLKKISLSALGFFLFNMISFIVGSILIFLGYGVYGAVTAFLTGQVFYAIFLVYTLSLNHKISFKPFDLTLAKTLLIKSWPYGVLSAIGFASFRLDTVILSYTRGGVETGIYSLAYRFLEAATIVPVAFGTVLYPVFSEHAEHKSNTKKLFRNSLLFGFLAGTGILIAMNLVIPWFLNRFLPESFFGSSSALIILTFAIPFIFMHIPMGQLLLSRQNLLRKTLLVYLFIFIINLALMLMIIPVYGFIGAAWITVIVEALTFVSFYLYINTQVLKN